MLPQKQLKAVNIEIIENALMTQILEVKAMLGKGELSFQYAAAGVKEPSLEKAMAGVDNDFLILHRELENARAEKAMLISQGMREDDPMMDALNWQLDSAQSALETRMIELKADKKIMLKVQLQFKHDDAMYKWAMEKRKIIAEQRKKMYEEYEALTRLKKELARKKNSGINIIFLLMGMSIMAWINQQRERINKTMREMHAQNIELLGSKPMMNAPICA